MATPIEYDLEVPDSDGATGEVRNVRGLSEKCVQISSFVGELEVRGSVDGVNYPPIQTVTDDGVDPDGSIVAVPFQLRTIAVKRVSVTGDIPTVKLAGLLL